MSCRDGSSDYSSAFAKLHWEVVLITPVRENTGFKKEVFVNIHCLPDAFFKSEQVPFMISSARVLHTLQA